LKSLAANQLTVKKEKIMMPKMKTKGADRVQYNPT
jgi:hypothetical protein